MNAQTPRKIEPTRKPSTPEEIEAAHARVIRAVKARRLADLEQQAAVRNLDAIQNQANP